jgi:hypothetical protein
MQNFPVSIMSAGHGPVAIAIDAEPETVGAIGGATLALVSGVRLATGALGTGELVGVEGGVDEGRSHENSAPAIALKKATTRRGAERVMVLEREPSRQRWLRAGC